MCPLPDDDNKDDIADTEGADKAKIHCFLQMVTYRELRMLALNAELIVWQYMYQRRKGNYNKQISLIKVNKKK